MANVAVQQLVQPQPVRQPVQRAGGPEERDQRHVAVGLKNLNQRILLV